MALSVHGLIIIATPVLARKSGQYSTFLSFQVASDNTDGTTTRYNISLAVSNSKVEEIIPKITKGVICEIVNGTLTDINNSSANSEQEMTRPALFINVKYEHFKLLKPCVFYAGVKKITE